MEKSDAARTGRHGAVALRAVPCGAARFARRCGVAATLATVAAVALPAGANAHVTVSPSEAPAGGYARLEFSVPHGCDGSPTTRIRVRIPRDVAIVKPGRNAFWTLATKQGEKTPVEVHGQRITRGPQEVIWTARTPLPDAQLDVLQMSVKLPEGAGRSVYFPTVQECERGSTAWIERPAAGQSADELEHPAPVVKLVASTGAHGGSASGNDSGHGGDANEASGKAPTWLAVVALVAGLVGTTTGVAGLRRRRA
ncbi:MAG: YcnI family protein [Thermoleophilum sp.]|nr:YcnI family protein [Thermoleophilum sp.]